MPTTMLSDDEFATNKVIFERHFYTLAGNHVEIAKLIRELDQAIILVSQVDLERPQEKREHELGVAMLFRNFLARYIGQPEIETPALVLPPPAVAEDDSAQPAQDAGVQVDSQAAA